MITIILSLIRHKKRPVHRPSHPIAEGLYWVVGAFGELWDIIENIVCFITGRY